MIQGTLPALFHREGDVFVPGELTRSPWDSNALNGVSLSGLIAFLLEAACDHSLMTVARLTIDILGAVPHRPLAGRVAIARDGRRMQLLTIELLCGERVVVRATALRIRVDGSPPAMPAMRFPPPESVALAPFLPSRSLGTIARTRPICGALDEPGPGTLWIAFDVQVVAGCPLTPLLRAALVADFGNGVGSIFKFRQWNFANLDICIQFLRLPRGEWTLIDALTESAGSGFALARSDFADVDGVYAHGFQTLFIAPR